MKGSDAKRNNPTKKEVSALNRDVMVFTFFLFIAFGLWYINSLGKETEADVKYSIKYVNIPRERVIDEETPPKLSFSLKGPGYSVLKVKVSGRKPPVLIDLSKVSFRHVPDSKATDYFIITSGLIKSLTVQIRSGCEIIAIKPDTLFFTLSKEIPKSTSGSR